MTQKLGIPYAPMKFDQEKAYTYCPECGVEIRLADLKDFESYTMREYAVHYEKEHAE